MQVASPDIEKLKALQHSGLTVEQAQLLDQTIRFLQQRAEHDAVAVLPEVPRPSIEEIRELSLGSHAVESTDALRLEELLDQAEARQEWSDFRIRDLADPMTWRATWHVRHRDGAEEDIVLDHGNFLEDSKGTAGQVLFSHPYAVKQSGQPVSPCAITEGGHLNPCGCEP